MKGRPDWNFYINLVRMLGFLPGNVSLYRTAFVHKSVSITRKNGDRINNERLEYLGDAILGAIVAEYLFLKFPDRDEGFMTKIRSQIVKRKNLNSIAENIGIPLMMQINTNPATISIQLYGNALEALIGAIYLDRGYKRARKFFTNKILRKHIDLIKLVKKNPDYKSQVIEWAQKNRKDIAFETTEELHSTELAHAFVSHVMLNDSALGTGRAGSKKEAEQSAAKEALSCLKNS